MAVRTTPIHQTSKHMVISKLNKTHHWAIWPMLSSFNNPLSPPNEERRTNSFAMPSHGP